MSLPMASQALAAHQEPLFFSILSSSSSPHPLCLDAIANAHAMSPCGVSSTAEHLPGAMID